MGPDRPRIAVLCLTPTSAEAVKLSGSAATMVRIMFFMALFPWMGLIII
jgi:hypothetical protein